MPRRKRKTNTHSGASTIRICSRTCLKVAGLLSILLLTSCAGKKVAPAFDLSHPQEAWLKAVGASCLSGEGKGSVEISKRKNSFSFASRATDESWLLGVSLPILGEEILQLDYQPFSASGELYQRLQNELIKKKLSPKLFDYQLRALSQLLGSWHKIQANPLRCKNPGLKGRCQNIAYTLDEEQLQLSFAIGRQQLHARYSQYNGKNFEQLILQLPSAAPISILLKFQQCSIAPQ